MAIQLPQPQTAPATKHGQAPEPSLPSINRLCNDADAAPPAPVPPGPATAPAPPPAAAAAGPAAAGPAAVPAAPPMRGKGSRACCGPRSGGMPEPSGPLALYSRSMKPRSPPAVVAGHKTQRAQRPRDPDRGRVGVWATRLGPGRVQIRIKWRLRRVAACKVVKLWNERSSGAARLWRSDSPQTGRRQQRKGWAAQTAAHVLHLPRMACRSRFQ